MENIIGILKYKDLFFQLTFREIKARYRRSVLGYAWALLVPLIHLLILSLVFSNIIKFPLEDIPYPVFLFVALVPWIFLSNAITSATSSVLANSSLVNKVSLPREILPISAVSARIIDFILSFLVVILFLFIYQVPIYATLILVPIIFLIQLMLILGVGFFLAAMNVFFRDIENILGILLTIWMYMSPIIYSVDMIPKNLRLLFYLNPMTQIINAYRDVILFGKIPTSSLLFAFLTSTIVLVGGYSYFKNRSKYFADVI